MQVWYSNGPNLLNLWMVPNSDHYLVFGNPTVLYKYWFWYFSAQPQACVNRVSRSQHSSLHRCQWKTFKNFQRISRRRRYPDQSCSRSKRHVCCHVLHWQDPGHLRLHQRGVHGNYVRTFRTCDGAQIQQWLQASHFCLGYYFKIKITFYNNTVMILIPDPKIRYIWIPDIRVLILSHGSKTGLKILKLAINRAPVSCIQIIAWKSNIC